MIFVSTSCLEGKNSKFHADVMKVVKIYNRLNIHSIELGAAHQPVHEISFMVKRLNELGKKYICHGNFPPTGDKRMLNICSQNPEMQKLVISSAKNSIDFLNKVNGSLFSLHCGYKADITIGIEAVSEKISIMKAMETGANTLGEICDYAKDHSINVAAENSPPEDFSISTYPSDLLEFIKKVSAKNLGILLDVGHARLAELNKGIPFSEFIKLQDKVLEFHVHQVVNGIDHQQVVDDSVFEGFDKDILQKAAVTLEAMGQSEKQILDSVDVISKAL